MKSQNSGAWSRIPYTILGACNPPLAHQALEADPDIGLVVILQRSGTLGRRWFGHCCFLDPSVVLSLVDKPGVEALATTVRNKLERVHDALQQTAMSAV